MVYEMLQCMHVVIVHACLSIVHAAPSIHVYNYMDIRMIMRLCIQYHAVIAVHAVAYIQQ